MAEWTIDELAQQAATSVRNTRLYQERGLLPPPRREGRRAFYGHHHLTRLKLIVHLAGRGFPLATIREMTDAWEEQRSVASVLGFEDALTEPFGVEPPGRITLEELVARYPSDDASALQRAVELGVLVPDGEEFFVPVPSLLESGAALARDGVPAELTLDVAAAILEAADSLAETFVTMFVEHLWDPFVEAGMPAEGWDTLTEFLHVQRRLGVRAVAAAVSVKLEERIAEEMRRHDATQHHVES